MNASSEMYPVFESPFPTLLTHTDNGLGIFVAHPRVDMAIQNIGPDDSMFRVVAGELNFFFPLKEHARVLLASRGGVLAFTDEAGMPWYTLEMQPRVAPALSQQAFQSPAARPVSPRGKFGRPTARPASEPIVRAGDEGEFSL